MSQQITITGTGKVAVAEFTERNDEITVTSLSVFHDNGSQSFYGRKQCSRHEWSLYKLIKNYLYA